MAKSQSGGTRQWFMTVFGGITAIATVVTAVGALVGTARMFFAGPRVVSFIAEPEVLQPGAPLVLRWQVEEADRVTIQPGIGEVALEGRRTLKPRRDIEYTLVAEKGLQQKVVHLDITVQSEPAVETPPTEPPALRVERPATPPDDPAPVADQPSTEATLTWTERVRFEGVGVVLSGLQGDAPPTAEIAVEPQAGELSITIKAESLGDLTQTIPTRRLVGGEELHFSERVSGGWLEYGLRYNSDRLILETRTRYSDDRIERVVRYELTRN
ncbi:MAG: hypothetical protein H7Y22_02970 [Gemmatimonadaceae bacterium]|nr:hypothetical protein [Gloeobacterales cyanobacterium ES-bin-141]